LDAGDGKISVLPLQSKLPVEMTQLWAGGHIHGINSILAFRPQGQYKALVQQVVYKMIFVTCNRKCDFVTVRPLVVLWVQFGSVGRISKQHGAQRPGRRGAPGAVERIVVMCATIQRVTTFKPSVSLGSRPLHLSARIGHSSSWTKEFV